jgi:cytoskeletal protein CcmA (bactofilin family)
VLLGLLDSGHDGRAAHTGAAPGGARTLIAREASIHGAVRSAGDLHVDGNVSGDIAVEGALFIGKSGSVKGPIEGRSVQLAGRVEGAVRGLERVDVLATGHLEGDVYSPRVTIAEGAYFQGELHMGAAPAPARGAKKP